LKFYQSPSCKIVLDLSAFFFYKVQTQISFGV